MEDGRRKDFNELSLEFAWVFESFELEYSQIQALFEQIMKLEPLEQKDVIDQIWTVLVYNLMNFKSTEKIFAFHQQMKSLNCSEDTKKKVNIEIQSKVEEILAKIPEKIQRFQSLEDFQNTLKELRIIENFGFDVNFFVEIFALKLFKFVENVESSKIKIFKIFKNILEFDVLSETRIEVFKALSRFGEKEHDKVVSIGQVLSEKKFQSIQVFLHDGLMDQNRKVMIWRYLYSMDDQDLKAISREIENLEKIEKINKKNPLFVDNLWIYYNTQEVVVVQEFLPFTLKDFIEQSDDPELIISCIPGLIESYLYALNYGITHGSITPESIFYNSKANHQTEEFQLKINFVGSVLFRTKGVFNSYSAPEICNNENLLSDVDFEKLDVYSLGLVLLNCLTLFRNQNIRDIGEINKYITQIPGPEWVQDIVSSMLKLNPEDRADFKTLQSKIPGIFTGLT
jgi:hypothetical protein